MGLVTLPGLLVFDRYTRRSIDRDRALAPSLKSILQRGDIKRERPPRESETWLPLYQANGRFGSCFGPWGLHAGPGKNVRYNVPGAMQFTHMQHFARGRHNADYLLPIAHIYWETEPEGVKVYRQHQAFFDGTITTHFASADYEITITSWFDAHQRDVAGFEIQAKGRCPAIIVSPLRKFSLIYDQQVSPEIDSQLRDDAWRSEISCLNIRSTLNVRSNARMESLGGDLRLTLKEGRNDILVSLNGDAIAPANKSLQRTKSWWNAVWQSSAWLDLPDDAAQKVWVRSLAYTFYSHNDDGIGCSPPTGLAGNGWPFPFPFDSGCRHLLLLSAGQIDSARKWIEFWHSKIDGLRDYTKRLYGGEGIFMPHVFPYGSAFGYHDPGVPNHYYYPVYNSALMVRMADQTAVMLNDPEWSRKYAHPLIEGAAKFYLSQLRKGDDGLWHLHLVPSISLDESGDINKPDYFSGLVSAQYALQKAVEYGLDNDGKMQNVLRDGLALNSLVSASGVYSNHRGHNLSDLNKQKHPDQLFPLVHTPLGPNPDGPTRKAHELRYEIASGANESRFIGHTLGEFILASVRMRDPDGWRKDWSMILPKRYADPDVIQFYESTGNSLSYYVTTHGLFAQALLETVVSTWWNQLDLAACIPWKGTVQFGNIRTLLGVTVSGYVKEGRGKVKLRAWKDTVFRCQGRSVSLKKGEEEIVVITGRS